MNIFNKNFDKNIGPVFLKENSHMDFYYGEMMKLKSGSPESFRKQIDEKLKYVKWGKKGEDYISYQLKSSRMDMYILHDVYFESKYVNAQIDFLIITRKHIYIIESKYLSGNIEIDSLGNFKRTGLKNSPEPSGMESPVTQNEKHILALEEACILSSRRIIGKIFFNAKTGDRYKPLVVFSNPKMYLETKNADDRIKNMVVKADRIIAYIAENDASSKNRALNDKDMYALAKFFLDKGTLKKPYSVAKDGKTLDKFRTAYENEKKKYEECIRENLRSYRSEKSRIENKKPYYIFKDADIDNLVKYKPSSIEELLKIPGFKQFKADRYGRDILEIINNAGKDS